MTDARTMQQYIPFLLQMHYLSIISIYIFFHTAQYVLLQYFCTTNALFIKAL
jgi:hypothetical protein